MGGAVGLADRLVEAFSASARIRVVFADVTRAAQELEGRHLSGVTAGLALGEGLAGAALLGMELAGPGEVVSLRMDVDGAVGGVLAEAGFDGGLRGYTRVKALDALDGREEPDAAAAMGSGMAVQVVRSAPGKVLATGAFRVAAAGAAAAVEGFYGRSLQRIVRAEVRAAARNGYVAAARGMMAERLPDGDAERFEGVLEAFERGVAREALAAGDAAAACAALGLGDCGLRTVRELRFACPCSQERVEGMLEGLPDGELAALAAEGRPARIFCHMCGKGYEVETARWAGGGDEAPPVR